MFAVLLLYILALLVNFYITHWHYSRSDLDLDPIEIANNADGGITKVFLPRGASTQPSSRIICHAFTYPKAVSQEAQVTTGHESRPFERLQRRGMVVEAHFSAAQLDLVLLLFYPALSKPGPASKQARGIGSMLLEFVSSGCYHFSPQSLSLCDLQRRYQGSRPNFSFVY
jgi:hypothetical protein